MPPPTTADRPRRIVWATGGAGPPEGVLADLARIAEVHVIAGERPPGEASLGGGTVSIEGVDWLWHPYPLERIPGAARVVRRVFAATGWPFERVHFVDRDREVANAVVRRCRARAVDLVIADGIGLTAALADAEAPVVAVAPTAAAGKGIDRWATRRWMRRTFAGLEVVPLDAIVERVASVVPTADPSATGAVPRPATASIVVATANRPDLLRQSLPAIAAAARSVPGTPVIIVEQGPPAARGVCEQVDVVADVVYDPGRGASQARNVGAQRATSDIVLFTDDDCLVPETWVRDHVDAFDGTVCATFGSVTGLPRAIAADDPAARPGRHRLGALPWHIGHGSNMAVQRDALLRVGGWDIRIGPGTALPAGEDADLIVRLLEDGGVVRSGVGSPVVHLPWRTPEAEQDTVRAYELGAGVWIGKALRRLGRDARPYLRGRRRLHRLQRADGVRGATSAFVRGLLRGVRLG